MSIHAKLAKVQSTLHAPKNQTNKFGGYNYRSCEDILQAVKPLLGECTIVVNDEIVAIADRIYVKATAVFSDGAESVTSSAFAREADQKKGMDPAQLTGATSSYARKYALNGLLLIDDNKDADSMDNGQSGQQRAPQRQQPQQANAQMDAAALGKAVEACKTAPDKATLTKYYQMAQQRGATADQLAQLNEACTARITEIGA